MPPILLEACVDSVESARAALAGGAGRIELAAELGAGGTTPSAGMIAGCREAFAGPLFVLIRPRAGDFVYAEDEIETMERDIGFARELGADGVVLGALRPDGRVDEATTERLVAAARPMAVTFHRAFDACRDLDQSLDRLIRLGVDRVLTAGGAPSAMTGIPALRRLVARAGGRIVILAGGSLDEAGVAEVVRRTGVREVHVRGVREVPGAMSWIGPAGSLVKPPPSDGSRFVTDTGRIRTMVQSLSELGGT